MNRLALFVLTAGVGAALVVVAGCSSEVRVTVLTEAPPTGHAELVDHGNDDEPDLHLALSHAVAVGLECCESEYTFDASYNGACRDFSFGVDDEGVATALEANLDALALPGAGVPGISRTGLVLLGGEAGNTVLRVEARGASIEVRVDVDEADAVP